MWWDEKGLIFVSDEHEWRVYTSHATQFKPYPSWPNAAE